MLYHNEVYMPANVLAVAKGKMGGMNAVRLSRHIIDWLEGTSGENALREKKHSFTKQELMEAIRVIRDTAPNPFEVEVVNGEVVKFCVRQPLNDDLDITVVIGIDKNSSVMYVVKTAWVNRNDDIHSTLDSSKYVRKV